MGKVRCRGRWAACGKTGLQIRAKVIFGSVSSGQLLTLYIARAMYMNNSQIKIAILLLKAKL